MIGRTFGLFIFIPQQNGKRGNMKKIGFKQMICIVSVFCAATAIAASAQTFTTILEYNNTDGAFPFHSSLAQGVDGNLYVPANGGGLDPTACRFTPGCGTIIQITTAGTPVSLYKFDTTNGAAPYAGPILASNGELYGTTSTGGANSSGTVFQIGRGGLTTLYNFCAEAGCADGGSPSNALIQGVNGNLYGMANGGIKENGTIFELTPSGTLTTLHNFRGTDGTYPNSLLQGADRNFYGTTKEGGGSTGSGVVFKMNAAGHFGILHSFDTTDGEYPLGLIQASDGNLYGTTQFGGANGDGTFFQITTGGTLTTLYNFCSLSQCADGGHPGGGVIQATDGNFYGTTFTGGANGGGTIYSITSGGALTTLYSVASDALPFTVLLQATDGNFYGTAESDGLAICGGFGDSGCGTVFSLSTGLAPFVKAYPTLGAVGRKVLILGTDLTGASSVTFNGTPATFTVASSTSISATVPSGASSGTIEVTTPGGVLSSNVAFQVEP
jgi:uncharacterized repeat protein (TIGR03803 family)